MRSEVKTLDDKLKKLDEPRELLEQKLEAMTINIGPFALPKIPKITQVVLTDFERNNFDKPVSRVERCESCHAGIDKAGLRERTGESGPQPYKTHPERELILGKHPPDKFGCTPCHQGQGAAVNSPEQAHGEVHHWSEPLMRGDKVQASCIKCHANLGNLKGASTIASGQKLFEELGCHGCHLVEGYEDLAEGGPVPAPGVGKTRSVVAGAMGDQPARVPSEDAHAELHVQDATRPKRSRRICWMPAKRTATRGSRRDRSPRVSIRTMRRWWPTARRSSTASAAAAATDLPKASRRHCSGRTRTSHPISARVAEKTDARWLYYWVKGPRDYSPVSRMPSLRLSDEEARAVVSFLLTLGTKQPTEGLEARLQNPDTIAHGKALVRKYGCFGCHDIPGMENESRIGVELSTFGSKTLEELFFGNHTDIEHNWNAWTFNKLKTPRTYATERIEQLMPQFDLADTDIKALRIFLASRTDLKYPARFHAENDLRGQREVLGRRVVARYNCVGCHIIEGEGGAIRARYQDSPTMAPPILNGEGAKTQEDWLFGFLKQPIRLRPWLKVRMPTFSLSDAEATTLVQYFGALDNIQVPFVHIDEAKIPPDYILAAEKLTTPDYFNCFSCHQQGDHKPEGPPEGWAPDLGMARHRLNPDWIVRWLHNPQAVQPGTKMPSFYEQDASGKASGGPDDILEGNNEEQIQSLADYLMVLDNAKQVLARNEQKDAAPATAAQDVGAAPQVN